MITIKYAEEVKKEESQPKKGIFNSIFGAFGKWNCTDSCVWNIAESLLIFTFEKRVAVQPQHGLEQLRQFLQSSQWRYQSYRTKTCSFDDTRHVATVLERASDSDTMCLYMQSNHDISVLHRNNCIMRARFQRGETDQKSVESSLIECISRNACCPGPLQVES